MNLDIFYTDAGRVAGETLTIVGEELRHLSRVVRKRAGDRICVTDGRGRMFTCVLRSVDRKQAICGIEEVRNGVGEPRVEVALALSFLKNPSRFEVAVEKATELGVRTVIPLLCERTVGRKLREGRVEGVALAAMKQSGRCVLPAVEPPVVFRDLPARTGKYALKLLPHEKGEPAGFISAVVAQNPQPASVVVAVGPEGGFTDREVSEAVAAGFLVVSLGPRRLRSETAAIRAVSCIVGEQ